MQIYKENSEHADDNIYSIEDEFHAFFFYVSYMMTFDNSIYHSIFIRIDRCLNSTVF